MSPTTGGQRRVLMNLESLAERVVPAADHLFAVGQDIGGTALVRVYHEDGSPAAQRPSRFVEGVNLGEFWSAGDVSTIWVLTSL